MVRYITDEKEKKEKMNKTLETVGVVHTRHFLNKRENVALSCVSFAM